MLNFRGFSFNEYIDTVENFVNSVKVIDITWDENFVYVWYN